MTTIDSILKKNHGFMRLNCNHTPTSVFYLHLLLCIWRSSSCFWLRWSAITMPGSWGFNCVIVVESSKRFDADPTGHITTSRPASLDTRKHENHWNNYTRYDTSCCCGRTEPVSISNCLRLYFQLVSGFSMHASVPVCPEWMPPTD